MVEFALAMPILGLLFMGSLGLGRLGYQTVIVGEAVEEAGKIAMIDRLSSDGSSSQQMSNDELMQWIRAASVEGDPTINKDSICPDGNWEHHASSSDIFLKIGDMISGYTDSTNQVNVGGNPPEHSTLDGLERWLNPGLQTARVKFRYQALAGDFGLTVHIQHYFTSYQMFTVPLNFPSNGAVSGC